MNRHHQQPCWCDEPRCFSTSCLVCGCGQVAGRRPRVGCSCCCCFRRIFLGGWGHRETHPEAWGPEQERTWLEDIQQRLWLSHSLGGSRSDGISIQFGGKEFRSECMKPFTCMTLLTQVTSPSHAQIEALWQLGPNNLLHFHINKHLAKDFRGKSNFLF